jgi:regulator of nucleoside diphosphate kinase
MMRRRITLTAEDHERLQKLLDSNLARLVVDTARIDELQAELDRAQIAPERDVPGDVVIMNSTITLRDLETHEVETYTLVYPDRADIANHKLSVLAPIGTAILGYRVGDEVRWRVPMGWRRFRVEQVNQQPEPAAVARL